jgi:mxaJ protein
MRGITGRIVMIIPVALFIASVGCHRNPPLRVCADPNNLPFSNQRLEGFENELAALLGRALDRPVRYTWWAQRRGFLKQTLNAGICDVVMGYPSGVDMVRTTRPYYRSSYVAVTRRERAIALTTLSDPRMATWKIGIPLVGDDGSSPPPAHALSRLGLIQNVVGYSVYGNYAEESPPSKLITAVADGEVDVAFAWGPMAGYFASRQRVPLDVTTIEGPAGSLPFAFDISMAVRRADKDLAAQIERVLEGHRTDVDRILETFHVPRRRP